MLNHRRLLRKLGLRAGYALLLLACRLYPLDDTLRMQDLQWKGTHNSYHVAPAANAPLAWAYTHQPLDQQLENQGVRQFELDVNGADLRVFHIGLLDDKSTCPDLAACLATLHRWSKAHAWHAPLIVQVELKDDLADIEALQAAAAFDNLLTPAMVQNGAASLRESLATRGWPTLRETRGKMLIYLLASPEFERRYTHDYASLEGRTLFIATGEDRPYRTIVNVDDPRGQDISALLAANVLTRTRADADGDEGGGGRNASAFAITPSIVATDYPVRRDGYWLGWPQKTGVRCHPRSATCRNDALE